MTCDLLNNDLHAIFITSIIIIHVLSIVCYIEKEGAGIIVILSKHNELYVTGARWGASSHHLSDNYSAHRSGY